MKILRVFLLFTLLTSLNCSSKQKENTKVEMEIKRPKYEITVFQSGKELGKIIIETFPKEAPKHAANFDSLVSIGFYNGTAFHRVIPGFMIQGGDPNTKNFPNDRSKWGMGDPSQTRVPAEFNADLPNWSHKRGILSAARTPDPNSATSQFFIMHADSPHLDRQYSIYGQVLEGIEVVDVIANTPKGPRDDPNDAITMQIRKLSE